MWILTVWWMKMTTSSSLKNQAPKATLSSNRVWGNLLRVAYWERLYGIIQVGLQYFPNRVKRRFLGLLITGVMRFFGLIMYPLKVTLGSLLNMDSAEWMVFTGGLLAMVNILKWMALLLLSIPGGGGMLVITAIQ